LIVTLYQRHNSRSTRGAESKPCRNLQLLCNRQRSVLSQELCIELRSNHYHIKRYFKSYQFQLKRIIYHQKASTFQWTKL